MVNYTERVEDLTAADLRGGFFVGWPNAPSSEMHLRVLQGSDYVVLAHDETTGMVIGYVTAITDGVLAAYIPHLEVLPAYQGQGIGTVLTQRMLARLGDLYMIDLLCNAAVQPFYQRVGMQRAVGMCVRNYERQRGE